MQRRFLRDFQQHLEQLARALETGQARLVTEYAEWLMPIYRRRHVPVVDQTALLGGLQQAAASVLTPEDGHALGELMDAWRARLKLHQALPGDHQGNKVVRLIWKGAGILDETAV